MDKKKDIKIIRIRAELVFLVTLLLVFGCTFLVNQNQQRREKLKAAYTAESTISRIEVQLNRYLAFAELLEKCIQWSLKSMIAAVSGISLIRGFLNPAIDSLKMTAAGRTLEAVPWIGDVAGGTMDVALGVAVLLKNGIGVAGMIFIAVLALIPLVEFLILAFLYQLVAALVQPVSDRRITTCISGVSSGYQLMVKVIASTTLLFVLSIALVVAVTS